jgi:hypothetical protein
MAASYTPGQGEFLAFIHDYTKLHGQPPSEGDMLRHLGTSPPSIHQMVVTLEKRGLIERAHGQPRSIRLLLPQERLPKDKSAKARGNSRPESILGQWRITQMDMWDQDFVDEEVEGYVRLDHGGSGEFQFGYVHGWIDHQPVERDGKTGVEWSWEGNDEMDSACGRGWAVLQDDGTMKGMLAFHRGDKSGFLAVRKGEPRQSAKKRTIISLSKSKRPNKS